MNKKILILAIILVVTTVLLCSCGNRQIGFDSVQSFNKAYLKLGDEWKILSIKSWRDFQDGDEVQITASDGTVYLTHYSNMILVNGK